MAYLERAGRFAMLRRWAAWKSRGAFALLRQDSCRQERLARPGETSLACGSSGQRSKSALRTLTATSNGAQRSLNNIPSPDMKPRLCSIGEKRPSKGVNCIARVRSSIRPSRSIATMGGGQPWIDRVDADRRRAEPPLAQSRPQSVDASGENAGQEAVFRDEGDFWTISYQIHRFRLRDVRGLHYIAYLLAHPNENFHARALRDPTAARPPLQFPTQASRPIRKMLHRSSTAKPSLTTVPGSGSCALT